MPKSQFRPDPNTVQSGWYNDRSGTEDRSIHVDGAMHKSAAQETARSAADALRQNPVAALSNPQLMMKALANGGRVSEEDMQQFLGGERDDPAKGLTHIRQPTDNPYVNEAAVQSGWFVKGEGADEGLGQPDADGHFDADVVLAAAQARLSKGDSVQPQDEDFDQEGGDDGEEPEELEASGGKKKDKGSGESYAKSLIQGLVQKGMYNDAWLSQFYGTPLEVRSIECELDYLKEVQKLRNKNYKGKDRDKFYQESDALRAAYGEKKDQLEIELLEHRKTEAKGRNMQKSYGLTEMEEWLEKSGARGEIPEDDAAGILSAFLGEDFEKAQSMSKGFSGHDGAGKGGMPEAGDPPGSMPTGTRKVDGGSGMNKKAGGPSDAGAETAASTATADLAEGNLYDGKGPQSQPVVFEDIEYDDEDVDLQQMAGGQRMAGLQKGGSSLDTGQFFDWSNATERSHQLRSMAKSIMQGNGDGDVTPHDFAGGPTFEDPGAVDFDPGEPEEFGKGMVWHSDASDRAVEKAFARHGDGTHVFAQTSVPGLDLRSPLLNHTECPHCSSLQKSFLTKCTSCGEDMVGGSGHQGVHYSEDLQKALLHGTVEG